MYSTLVSLSNQQERKKRLSHLLSGNEIIATASLDQKRIYKVSSDTGDSAEWERLLEACENKAYSQKELDAIGDKITTAISPVIRPIFEGLQAAGPYLSRISEKTLAAFVGKTASNLSTRDRRSKLSKFSKKNFNDIYFVEKELLSLAEDSGIYANSLEELSFKLAPLRKEAGQVAATAGASAAKSGERAAEQVIETAGEKAAGKAAGKSTGLLPIVGLVVDLTLASKNLYEAWINGKKIITELPISKYGISTAEAIISTPGNTKSIAKKLKRACMENTESPSNLYEILEIAQTMKGYATDFVSAITNSLMSIIDILEILPVLGSFVAFLLSIPLVAVEIANDTVVEKSYEEIILMIKGIATNKLESNEGEDVSFSQEDRDFASSLLTELREGNSTTLENKAARLRKLDYLMKACH